MYDHAVLIAQAAGEYGALSSVGEAFRHAFVQAESALGGWGTTGVLVLVAAGLLWLIIERFR